MVTKDVPVVKTETRTVTYSSEGGAEHGDAGDLVSAQSHSSHRQTVETTTVRRFAPTLALLFSLIA